LTKILNQVIVLYSVLLSLKDRQVGLATRATPSFLRIIHNNLFF